MANISSRENILKANVGYKTLHTYAVRLKSSHDYPVESPKYRGGLDSLLGWVWSRDTKTA
jgi:hypothetical protein